MKQYKLTSVLIATSLLMLSCVGLEEKKERSAGSKPEYEAPSYMPGEKLIALAVQALRTEDLLSKYNVAFALYVETPSQMGEEMVVFCLTGAGIPETGERSVDCIVHVSSLLGKVLRIEEISPESEELRIVSVNADGRATGYYTKKRTPNKALKATDKSAP